MAPTRALRTLSPDARAALKEYHAEIILKGAGREQAIEAASAASGLSAAYIGKKLIPAAVAKRAMPELVREMLAERFGAELIPTMRQETPKEASRALLDAEPEAAGQEDDTSGLWFSEDETDAYEAEVQETVDPEMVEAMAFLEQRLDDLVALDTLPGTTWSLATWRRESHDYVLMLQDTATGQTQEMTLTEFNEIVQRAAQAAGNTNAPSH